MWSEHSILFNEAVLRQEQQVATSLDIGSIGPTSCPGYAGPYDAIVENAGSTSFDDFTEMDVLVDYTDAADNKVAARLQYDTDWSISSITPDERDPNLWNSTETATITFTLDSQLKPDTSGVFIIATPQGVTDSAYFTCPPTECDGDTGFLSPTAEAADTGGNDDGFESSPANAFADDNNAASNLNLLLSGDRHRFYNYGFSIPSGCAIQGIEVRLDWRLLDVVGSNSIDVELSWDGAPHGRGPRPTHWRPHRSTLQSWAVAPIPGAGPGLLPSLMTPISECGLLLIMLLPRPSSWTGWPSGYITSRRRRTKGQSFVLRQWYNCPSLPGSL